MVKLSSTRLVVAVGGLALWLTAGAGVALAEPGMGAAINTTCNYPQVMAALNAQSPAAAAQVSSAPVFQSYLATFLASPVAQRQQMAQQVQAMPGAQQYLGLVAQVANTCNNY